MNAYYKMETMEHFAKILFVANQLGGYNELNAEQVAKLVAIRNRMGLRGPDPACDVPDAPTTQSTTHIPTIRTLSAGGTAPAQTSQDDLIAEITRRVMEELK